MKNFDNFFKDMMEELDRKVQEERDRREDEAEKYAEQKRKSEDAAGALWDLYSSLIGKGFTPPQAMELLKTILPKATFGGHK